MNPKQYRPILLKTTLTVLKQAQTQPSKRIEDLAERITDSNISGMQVYEEMLTLAGQEAVLGSGGADPYTDSPILPTPVSPEPIPLGDLSERLPVPGRLVERFTKDQLHDYYGKHLPPSIEVWPAGFVKPVKLTKRLQMSPGDMTFLRIQYLHEGGNPDTDCMQTTVQTTDPEMNAQSVQAVLDEIRKQALSSLSASPRHVEPRFAIPPPESLDASLGGSPSAETDREASSEDMAAWGPGQAGNAANRFGHR